MKTLPNRYLTAVVMTALVPVIWGSTYIATTQWLPPERPFTAATIRALPAGLILVLLGRSTLTLRQIPMMVLLSLLNIAIFQGMLFTAAYLLPGGIAAVVGSIQPLLVMGLVWVFDRQVPGKHKIVASLVAITGMALLFSGPESQWNLPGVLAAFFGTLSMATGVYISSKWNHRLPNLSFTGWQLLIGGAILTPVAVLIEEPIMHLTTENIWGYVYISVFGALIGYTLWFRGLKQLSPTTVASLGLLSPLTATLLDWVFLGESLGIIESAGIFLVMASILALQTRPNRPTVASRIAQEC